YIIDGALELCTELAKTHNIYCVTNGIGGVQRRRLAAVGLAPLFSGIFISDEIGYQKPMKEFFKLAFAGIKNLNLSQSIIVGDSLTSDMRGGNAIGIDTCWYNPNGLQNTMGCKINYDIRSLSQIPAIVG
ncbi:MAG: HAD-IA family hydrolase, partial [Oscillospiraceae bacterium]